MDTRKLYYEDCHLARFTAVVLSCRPGKAGYRVVLDQTAFFPEGGGQAGDTGTLGGVRVLDTREMDGEICHLCDGPLEAGARVEGSIDYERRFSMMQQHTGEHILSGLVYEDYGYHNTGFHMGEQVVTVDFDGEIPAEALPGLERRVNEAIWKNIPLEVFTPAPQELPHVFYRTKRALPWPVRIVRVPGYDSCACCGVHVAATGEVGMMKILSCVRFREGARLEIVCGDKALSYLRQVFEQNRLVSQAFSARVLETGAAARQMNAMLAAEKYRAAGLENRLFALIADSCSGRGDVLHFEQSLTPGSVRMLADRIAERCGGVAAVFSGSDGEGYACALVTRNGDLRELGKKLNQTLSGRGGGRDGFFQGSVKAARAEIEAFFANS